MKRNYQKRKGIAYFSAEGYLRTKGECYETREQFIVAVTGFPG